jgi:hypothetical protein
MAENSRNNTSKTLGRGRGRPFEKGNAGRPKGVRNRATMAAAVLLDGEAEALVGKAVELALGYGCAQALSRPARPAAAGTSAEICLAGTALRWLPLGLRSPVCVRGTGCLRLGRLWLSPSFNLASGVISAPWAPRGYVCALGIEELP